MLTNNFRPYKNGKNTNAKTDSAKENSQDE